MNKFRLTALVLAGSICFSKATAAANLCQELLRVVSDVKPATLTVLELFDSLSPVRATSKNEFRVREILIRDANENGLSYEPDNSGNLVVRVPATGKFLQMPNVPPIAFQTHMDSLEDRAENVDESIFEQPLDYSITQGSGRVWVQSKGALRNISADPRLGLSIMRRWIRDLSLAHPPLELVFTADEELGGTGVKGFSIPLKSRMMLNLDGENLSAAVVATIGQNNYIGQLDLASTATAPLGTNDKLFKLSVAGLIGGHSGLDIDMRRINSVVALQRVLKNLTDADPNLRLVEIQAGREKAGGSIPKQFSALIASARLALNKIENILGSTKAALLSETGSTEELQFSVSPQDIADNTWSLSESLSHKMIDGMGRIAQINAVQARRRDGGVLDCINFNFFILRDGQTPGSKSVSMMVGPRSFESDRLAKLGEKITRLIGDMGARVSEIRGAAPWRPGDTSKLFQEILRRYDSQVGFNHAYVSGTPEAAHFLEHVPELDISIWGTTIEGAHGVYERFDVFDLQRLIIYLDDFLVNYPFVSSN